MARLHSDAATAGLRDEINELKRQVRALKTALTLQSASIGAGGLSVVDEGEITIAGGALRVTDTARQTGVAYLGSAPGGDPIWAFSFDDGEFAFGLGGTPGATYWAGRDYAGNPLVSSDALSGHGLARPWLSYPMIPTQYAEQSGTSMWPSTTATTAGTPVLGIVVPIQHPRLHFGATVTADAGTGHWRLVIQSSTQTTTLVSDETGFAEFDLNIPGWGDDITFGESVSLRLEAWVTGGGTRVWAQYDRCYGLGS